jgi:hypothetical protein
MLASRRFGSSTNVESQLCTINASDFDGLPPSLAYCPTLLHTKLVPQLWRLLIPLPACELSRASFSFVSLAHKLNFFNQGANDVARIELFRSLFFSNKIKGKVLNT